MAQFQYDIVSSSIADAAGVPQGFEAPVVKSAGGAIGSSAIRITIDTANITTADGIDGKTEVIKELERFKAFFLKDTWPPT